MSLPLQTTQLIQTARDLVKGLPADAVLLLTETSLDWEEIARILVGVKVFVAAENPALLKPLKDDERWHIIEMAYESLPIQERLSNALLHAVTSDSIQPGAHVVVLYNGIATLEDAPEPIDSVSVIHLGEHLERMTSQDLRILGPDIPIDVLRAVVDLATEVGREGREGQPIGTIIVVGDTRRVLKMSRFQNFNPFRGYTKSERDVRDKSVREQIKEIAKLDGAILIGRDGIAEAACLYLDVPSDGIDVAKGFGSRHMSAAGVSRHTKAIAFCVSQSSGTLRIFQDGAMKLHIEPLARPHVWQPVRLENAEDDRTTT
ncbi:MAG: DNA integrity scanning protein DisA nucleotide-binding domain protein [Fimbriiglobus sp.]